MGQRDIHFYGTLAIAKAAGYSDADAKLIAWADEETDYTLQCQWYNPHRWNHYGLCFHFWPGDKDNLICSPDSELSKRIITNVTHDHLTEQGLCAIGIAAHGLQDSLFHRGWVGKFSRHNCLPLWSKNKFTPSIPFPFGHTALAKIPDIASAMWYDPRNGQTIHNRSRAIPAAVATAKVLGTGDIPAIIRIFAHEDDYETRKRRLRNDYDTRKRKLRNLAGMPDLRFSDIREGILKKYGKVFMAAAKEQAKIVKEYLCKDDV